MKKILIIAAIAATLLSTSSCKHRYDISDNEAQAVQDQYDQLATIETEGKDFIAKQLKADPALKQTKSGLVYKITAPGKGDLFKETDTVVVNYTGKHIDGKVFDSSVERGEPATFPVNGVIPGFKEMLTMMRPGAKAYCIIPGKLAYGQGTPDGSIAPLETLVFEIEAIGLASDNGNKSNNNK